jgi:hypothetical protein
MKMKAEYVAKYGYTMTVPGLSDIFHIGLETKMTKEEVGLWKARKYDAIPPGRREEIRKMKAKRKAKFLAMLASPTPHIVNNAGSLMTSIDDAQDALGTLAFTGRLALAAAPRMMAKALAGPVGWTLTAAEMLNLVQHLGYQRLGSKKAKREKDKATKDGWKSKLYKIRKAARMKGIWPSQGRIVEALQVSDNVFGFGICLGPIVGFAIETVTGPMRRITGAKVDVKVPWPFLSHFTMKAQRQARSQLAYIGAGLQTDPEEVIGMAMANYLSHQEILSHATGWNAFDNVDDLSNVELMAPVPDNVLTIEVIEEEGIRVEDVVGWPHNDEKWLLINDIPHEYDGPCRDFQSDFMGLHNHDWFGYAYSALTTQATGHIFAAAEGEDKVEYDFTAQSKWGHIMLDNGLVLTEGQAPAKIALIIDEIERLEEEREKPTLRNILAFCKENEIILESFLSD